MRSIFFLALLLTPFFIFADDFQAWNELTIKHPLHSEWSAETILSSRFKNDASKAYLYFLELDLVKKFSCGWSLYPGYRHYYRLDESNHWINEPTPLFAVIKSWEWNRLVFTNRSRVEYHFNTPNKLHYRHRIMCEFPQIFKSWHPLIADEVFFREKSGYYQNRFFVGIKGYGITSGYIRRVERGDPWVGTKILYLAFEKEI